MLTPAQLLAMLVELYSRENRECMGLGELSEKLFIGEARLKAAVESLAARADSIALRAAGGGLEVCITSLVEAALDAVRLGAPENIATRGLDWRAFEAYTAKALEEAGFTVYRNVRISWPKPLEVDVVGLDSPAKLALALDCKHWNPRHSTPSRLREAARKHRERVDRLARYWWKTGLPRGEWTILPALIVLREQNVPRIAEGVLVVPVSKLKGFLQELPQLAQLPELHKPKTTT